MKKPYTIEQLQPFAGARIIGIGHHSRVGNDFVAGEMVRRANFKNPLSTRSAFPDLQSPVEVIKFAEPMKEAAYLLFRSDGIRLPAAYDIQESAVAQARRDESLHRLGNRNAVQVWVELGLFLESIRPGWMADQWRDTVTRVRAARVDPLILATDLRRPGEAETIRAMGGKTIRLLKKGWKSIPDSVDQDLDGWEKWDLTVEFEQGDLDGLRDFAADLLAVADPARWGSIITH